MKPSLVKRVVSLEVKAGLTEDFPTIGEVIKNCPDERSRRDAMWLTSGSGLLDVKWISSGMPVVRGMTHVVEDRAALSNEPFRWGWDVAVQEKWSWIHTVCMLLDMVLDLEHVNHFHILGEVEEMMKGEESSQNPVTEGGTSGVEAVS